MTERARWVLRGARGIAGLPALVLMSAMIGFGGLAREAGLDVFETMFAIFVIWALPSAILLVGSVIAGLGLLPTALAVALVSIRFAPMVMSIVPEMRAERTRPLTLYVLAHFVAVTSWVHGTQNFPRIPREHRTAFFGGFAVSLTVASTLIAGASHMLAATLPSALAATLVFLTPIYFLMTLWASARFPSDRPALALGLLFGPLAQWLFPSAGLIVGGLAAGTLAWVWTRQSHP